MRLRQAFHLFHPCRIPSHEQRIKEIRRHCTVLNVSPIVQKKLNAAYHLAPIATISGVMFFSSTESTGTPRASRWPSSSVDRGEGIWKIFFPIALSQCGEIAKCSTELPGTVRSAPFARAKSKTAAFSEAAAPNMGTGSRFSCGGDR